ncbi:MAG TPA: glutamate-1-semialdehyde 2,1-aminomutase [Clostridiales bacterium]|nr:glutamate-1-semialdehyde 2,1-aminomutase [Clostridiales bacterium]
MRLEKSERLYEKACELMPGGVNSPVRAFRSVGGSPLFIDRAKGSRIYDTDGNEFIDYVGSWGPAILGHARQEVVEAVTKACEKGLTFGAPTEQEVVLAELIRELMPGMGMLRLVSSGTEAVMSAIRVARGYTKRDKIIKFRGCYHGHSDGLLVKAGSAVISNTIPDSAGVPRSYTDNTLVADYNDIGSVQSLFEQYKGQIAAVIVEPVAANMGVVLPKPGFLESLRILTKEQEALLIFDEVITGFRIALGGASAFFNIQPDLTVLGKIVGGGMPIGAYGGRKDIMQLVAPLGDVYQAGTLSGNPVATAAGITTLSILKNNPEIYQELERKAVLLKEAFQPGITAGLITVNQVGSLQSAFFTSAEVYDFNSALASDTKKYAEFFHHMLENGIYIAPAQFEAIFLSDAHTEEDIRYTAGVVREYFSM